MSSNCECRNLQNADFSWIWAADNKETFSGNCNRKEFKFCMNDSHVVLRLYISGTVYITQMRTHHWLSEFCITYSHLREHTQQRKYPPYISADTRDIYYNLCTQDKTLQLICYHYYSEVSISTALGVNNLHVCTILFWQSWKCNNKVEKYHNNHDSRATYWVSFMFVHRWHRPIYRKRLFHRNHSSWSEWM